MLDCADNLNRSNVHYPANASDTGEAQGNSLDESGMLLDGSLLDPGLFGFEGELVGWSEFDSCVCVIALMRDHTDVCRQLAGPRGLTGFRKISQLGMKVRGICNSHTVHW